MLSGWLAMSPAAAKSFLRRGKHVLAPAEDDIQAAAVQFQSGLLRIEPFHFLFAYAKQLGGKPGRSAGERNPERHNLA